MNLIELVCYFRNSGSFDEFCLSYSLNIKSEVIEIYMEKPFTLDSTIAFFEIEKTEGKLEYVLNGITFFNLFDFFYFIDAVKESNYDKNKLLKDNEIAYKLLNYAIYDA
ncbi:MAG: hypothetical protein MUC49_06695 [Raineya sp.]|jgi:hypothetical protein|nr:hypothetical protein [Raineya sp.]